MAKMLTPCGPAGADLGMRVSSRPRKSTEQPKQSQRQKGAAKAAKPAAGKSLMLTLLLPTALASVQPPSNSFELPSFAYKSPGHSSFDHYKFGMAIGSRFAPSIRHRLNNSRLQLTLLPYISTSQGQKTYRDFFEVHNRTFPSYMAELEGMAVASRVPLSHLFVMNLEMEFGYFANAKPSVDQCSDYMIANHEGFTLAHNEDSLGWDRNHTFMLQLQVNESFWSTSYVYSGDLPSGAFAWNSHGIGFTLNYVHSTAPTYAGIGRAFLSRWLLEATTLQEAQYIATGGGHPVCGGHNYQIFDTNRGELYNLEVAPHVPVLVARTDIKTTKALGNVSSVWARGGSGSGEPPLRRGAVDSAARGAVDSTTDFMYHANMYLALAKSVEQDDVAGSIARQVRASK
jgi:hypothetical protein